MDREKLQRPKTRGELHSFLQEGVACEVTIEVSEMTAIMLRGWLDFDRFKMRPSHNEGWMLFVPEED